MEDAIFSPRKGDYAASRAWPPGRTVQRLRSSGPLGGSNGRPGPDAIGRRHVSPHQKRIRRNVALIQPSHAQNVRELISGSHAEPCKGPVLPRTARAQLLFQGTTKRGERCSQRKQRAVRSSVSLLSQMGAFGALGRCGRCRCWGLDLVLCGLVPEIAGLLEERRPPDTPFG